MVDKKTVLFMTQSIPRAFVRHLSFFYYYFGKTAPRTTRKLHFPINRLQMPYLLEICNNLIKTNETPDANGC